MELKKRTIPANAILHDFRMGPGHEGLAQFNPDVVSFHYRPHYPAIQFYETERGHWSVSPLV